MTNTERISLNRALRVRCYCLFMKDGFVSFFKNKKHAIISVIYILFMLLFYEIRMNFIPFPEPLPELSQSCFCFTYFIFVLCSFPVFLFLLGMPSGYLRTMHNIRRTGLRNAADEPPILMRRYPDPHNSKIEIQEYVSYGIPLSAWTDYREKIESALNVNLVTVSQGKNNRYAILKVVPSMRPWPEYLPWQDSFLDTSSQGFTLVLGESPAGPVTVNLAKIPHILIGGSTGSGKSVLLKLLLMQALKKGAVVYLADFKGGVDFPLHWHRLCRMCFDEHTLVDILTELLTELERRKQLFKSEDCPNIDEYNLKTGENLPRCLFACDEVSELLSRGITKEQKELTIKIEQMLASIARLGRAFGIHLILATQRPDATIISGQIKNNIDFRVCGRADNVLSQIVLDSTDAADLIPKDVSGRFLLQDGTLFQAYWFDDRLLF